MDAPFFPDFRNDPRQYQNAEKFWQDQWLKVVQQFSLTGWKTPWLTTSFADGASQADGNPIFSALRTDRPLGVRVIQLDPAEVADEFTYWYDEFAAGDSESVQELVISCVLTSDNASRAMDLITDFVQSGGRSKISA